MHKTIGGLTARMLMNQVDGSPGGGAQPLAPSAPPPITAAPPANQPAPAADPVPPANQPPAADPVPPVNQPPAPTTSFDHLANGGKPVVLPQAAFKKLKEEAAAKGGKAATDSLLKELGFKSAEELKNWRKKVEAQARQPRQAAPTQAPPGADPKATKEIQTLHTQLAEEKRARVRASNKVRELESELQATRARGSIEKELVREGVNDVDYAYSLVERKMADLSAGKSTDAEIEAAMAAFDVRTFIGDTLRKERPYLFSVSQRPATTGPGPSASPPPPKPGVTQQQTTPAPKTVRDMSPKEFQAYLKSKNLGNRSI